MMKKEEMTSSAVQNHALRQAREARGWSQRELASSLQVGLTTVRSWEAGRRAPGRVFQARLCEVFDLSLEQLGISAQPSSSSRVEEGCSNSHVLNRNVINKPGTLIATEVVSPSLVQARKERTPDPNRRKMLSRVRNTWIDGVLARSLNNASLISLDLMEIPEALDNPWYSSVQETTGPMRSLPSGTTLLQLFDIAGGSLLVLGEPGAGKTTLLLELARVLLLRAEQNEQYPMPVIFHLAAWSARQPAFAEWLVEELIKKYSVPQKVGQVWTETDRFVLLLDGLDEIAEEARLGCVKAICAYQEKYPDVSLVVSCRQRGISGPGNQHGVSAGRDRPAAHTRSNPPLSG